MERSKGPWGPSSTTAAEQSSQLDSRPRINIQIV
jgi:hypothetical protein